MCSCYIHLNYKIFNDHILLKLLNLYEYCKIFRGPAENPWVRSLKKNWGKRGGGQSLDGTLG
jgi:hypothetical protein